MSLYVNPEYYKGPRLEAVSLELPKAGWTGQAGQFVRRTDSGIVLCKSGATAIHAVLAATQSAVTVATTRVPIYNIPSAATKFIIGVTNASADDVANKEFKGRTWGLAVNSCVCSLTTGNESNVSLMFDNTLAELEAEGNDTDATPGFAIAHVLQSVLDAEGSGG